MTNTKIAAASKIHEECRLALASAITPYADKLGAASMLAVASAFVGQLLAMQDQRTMTPGVAMEIVAKNIELANHDIVNHLRDVRGYRA